MTNTSKYGLKKPEANDYYNVEDFNYNADKIEEALNEKVDKASPEISGTVKITKAPVKIVGKNFAGEDTTLLMTGANASDNLWIGIDGNTEGTKTHGGNTYISAGKNGQIRAVLSQEGTTYEMLHRGNIDDAVSGKADKVNPVISGTVRITEKPVKIVGKNYEGEDTTLLMTGANASDNLWIGIDNITATATHGGNTYISAGKNGQIRAVLSHEGASYEMLHRGNVNQVLWEGSWKSGDITVLGANNYRIFHVEFLEQGCPIIMMKKEGFLRGIGGYASNNGIIVYGFRGAYAGEKFSFLEARNLSISTGNTNELIVNRIIGLI